MFHRIINLPESHHFFLFGARGTGKTTLLRTLFKPAHSHTIDLLLATEEDRFTRSPDLLQKEILGLPPQINTVIIDEIQKVPKLLDVVHYMIETPSRPIRFVLTGSSARKLKRGQANLLAGRAFTRHLYPLTVQEMGSHFDLDTVLSWGSLPKILSFEKNADRIDYLQTYAFTYLKEEIQTEQVVRKLDPFRRFLEVAAQYNGKIINYSNIAKDTGTDSKTVKSYYEILEDTLIGFYLESFHNSRRKRLRNAPKFYFFDLGAARALSRQLSMIPAPGTSYYGDIFEQFVILEFFRREAYLNREYQFSYLGTLDGAEVDLVIERPGKPLALIEIKSSEQIRESMLSSLNSFAADFKQAELYCISRDPVQKIFGRIRALDWKTALEIL